MIRNEGKKDKAKGRHTKLDEPNDNEYHHGYGSNDIQCTLADIMCDVTCIPVLAFGNILFTLLVEKLIKIKCTSSDGEGPMNEQAGGIGGNETTISGEYADETKR
jgi:hypothetical protein